MAACWHQAAMSTPTAHSRCWQNRPANPHSEVDLTKLTITIPTVTGARDHIGDRQIPIFSAGLRRHRRAFRAADRTHMRHMASSVRSRGDRATELDVARLHERGHQVAEGGSVLRGREVRNGECYCRRIAMINRYGPFMTCGSTYSLFSVAGQQRADAR